MDRRRFLKVTAITGTSAALASCGSPENQIIRFVPDEELSPGIAVWKPSVCPLCAAGCGVTARVMDGDAEVFRGGQPGVLEVVHAGSEAAPDFLRAMGVRDHGQFVRVRFIDDRFHFFGGHFVLVDQLDAIHSGFG